MGRIYCIRNNFCDISNIRKGDFEMIVEIILLVVIILILVLLSMLAFLGKKNLLLFFAILEAALAILFAILIGKP